MSTSTWKGVSRNWGDGADWTGGVPNSSSANAVIGAADGNQITISDGEVEPASMTDASATLALEGMSLLTATGAFANSSALDLDSDYEGDGGGSPTIAGVRTNNSSSPVVAGDLSAALTLAGLINASSGGFSVYGSPSDAATLAFDGGAGFAGDSRADTPLTLSSGTLDLDADYSGGSPTIGGAPTNSGSVTIGNTSLSAATTVTLGGLSNDSSASFAFYGSSSRAPHANADADAPPARVAASGASDSIEASANAVPWGGDAPSHTGSLLRQRQLLDPPGVNPSMGALGAQAVSDGPSLGSSDGSSNTLIPDAREGGAEAITPSVGASEALGSRDGEPYPPAQVAGASLSALGSSSAGAGTTQSADDNAYGPSPYSPFNGDGATPAQVLDALDANDPGVTGAGITVGVISDSFNYNGYSAADLGYGTVLPSQSQVNVLNDVNPQNAPSSDGTDEGRAMMQVIHDIAPGASLDFCTEFGTAADFANGIQGSDTAFADAILALAAAGCKVICDDVTLGGDPWFQSGVVANAIQTVEEEGVTYLSCAGNSRLGPSQGGTPVDPTAYQSAWSATSINIDGYPGLANGAYDALNFGSGPFQTLTLQPHASCQLEMQWAQPWGAATTNLALMVSENGEILNIWTRADNSSPSGESVDLQNCPLVVGAAGYLTNNSSSAVSYQISIVNLGGPDPSLVKYIAENDGGPPGGITISGANAGSVHGHNESPYGSAIGAVDAGNTPAFGQSPALNEFYSAGDTGTEWLYAPDGSAYSSAEQLSPVLVSGVDDINTSDVVDGVDYTIPGLDDFFGTSCATPSVAAIAALMLQANSNLTPSDVQALLAESAIPMGNSDVSGAGLAQADVAVDYAQGIFNGGGLTINLLDLAGDPANLSDTGGDWDTVNGSNGTVYLTNAQASVYGGGDTVDLEGASGNVASLYDTGGDWDTVNGSGGTIDLTDAQATVNGSGTIQVSSDSLLLLGTSGQSINDSGDEISGAGAVEIETQSTVVLGPNDSYSGGTTVDEEATLSISAADDIGAGALTLQDGATLDLTTAFTLSNAISISGSVTINVTYPNLNYLAGLITGAGALVVTGGGGLALEGDNTYTLGTTVDDATLAVTVGGALGSGGLTLEGGAAFLLGADFTLGTAISVAGDSYFEVLTGDTATISGVIGDDLPSEGSLTVVAGGALVLGGANTYSGGTTVDSGATLSISNSDNVGSGGLTLESGATLDLTTAFTLPNAISVSGAATIDVTSEWTTLQGPIADVTGGEGSLNFNLSSGAGLVLSNHDTYSGGTTVNGGALDIFNGDALGLGSVTLNNVADFFLNGEFTLVNAISILGVSNISVLTGDTATINQAITGATSGLVVGGGAPDDYGTLVLAGANTYSGGTTVVSGATLAVSNNSALGSGGLTLDTGATLALTGSSLTLSGAFSQGAGSTTTIATGDSLTLSGGASLSGTTSGAGTLALAGGTTMIAGGSSVSVPIEFTAGGTLELLGAASVSVSGSNGAISAVSGDTIALTSGTGDTVTGTAFTVNASSGTGVTVGGNTVSGNFDAVDGSNADVGVLANSRAELTGSSDTVTMASGGPSHLVVYGSNDTISAATGDVIYVEDANSNLTVSGSNLAIIASTGDVISLVSGTGDTVTGAAFTVNASSGTGVTVGGNTVSGNFDAVDGSNAVVGVLANSRAELTGSSDTVTMASGGPSHLVVYGSNDTISAATGDVIYVEDANSNLTVSGSNLAIIASTGDVISLVSGTGDTVTGTAFTVDASSGTGVTVGGNTVSGNFDAVDGSNADVGVLANSRAELTGSSDTVTMASGGASHLVVSGSNDTISAATGDVIYVEDANSNLTVSGSNLAIIASTGDVISLVSGTGDTVTGTAFTVNASSGTGVTVGGNTVSGNFDAVDGSNAVVGVLANSRAELTGSSDTVTMASGGASHLVVYGSNDTISAATGDVIYVEDANSNLTVSGSNLAIIASTGDVISLVSGTGDTVTGTGFTVDASSGTGVTVGGNTVSGNFDAVDGSNADVGVLANSRAELTGSSDTVTMASGGASHLVVYGSNDTISGATGDVIYVELGGDDTVTAGSDDTVNLIGTADIVYAGLSDSITDGGTSSVFKITGSVAGLTVSGFGADTASGVFDLLGGEGGYTTAGAAYAALTSDGHGGSLLSFGTAGSLDIVGVGKTSLSAANFKIG